MLRKVPLIVILGSTGTGKTRLSLEIAERLGSEIISADSMQVYANLDIVTAKATKEEQARVPHHLLDVASPAEPFTVLHFRNSALPIINELLAQSKSPIVVGGTNYYIESLLWNTLVSSLPETEVSATKELELETISTAKLYEQLQQIDPLSAMRIHPNNKRKIIRALEVYSQTGKPLSDILKRQRGQPGGNRLGGPLRYPHTILFWLKCQQDTLNHRLDKRVDSMLELGLLEEVRNFYEQHKDITSTKNFTKGILQSIGFKEFIPYLEKFDRKQDEIITNYLKANSFAIPENDDNIPDGLELLNTCLENLKLVTKRYSKNQMKWIKNRFLGSRDRQVPPIYELNAANANLWDSTVYQPALNVIESYMRNTPSLYSPLEPIKHPSLGLNEETSHYCNVCNRHFIGEFQWTAHVKSNKHKRAKYGQQRKEKLDKNLLNTS